MFNSATSRALLAFLSACGFAASVFMYAESFRGSREPSGFSWWIVLIPVWLALFAPIYALEYPASRRASFAWKEFALDMPDWVAPCSRLFSAVAVRHPAEKEKPWQTRTS